MASALLVPCPQHEVAQHEAGHDPPSRWPLWRCGHQHLLGSLSPKLGSATGLGCGRIGACPIRSLAIIISCEDWGRGSCVESACDRAVPEIGGLQMSDLTKALADVRTHLRTVLISTCPDEHKVPLRDALEVV